MDNQVVLSRQRSVFSKASLLILDFWNPLKTRLAHESIIVLKPVQQKHLVMSFKNFLMIPVLPLIGYYGLDATGVTAHIIGHNAILARIMGEGFGHAGLCFSLHYVIMCVKHLWKGLLGVSELETNEAC